MQPSLPILTHFFVFFPREKLPPTEVSKTISSLFLVGRSIEGKP